MGKVDSVPVFGEGFNRAMPVIVLLPALLTYFKIFDKILRIFSFDMVEENYTSSSSSSINSENGYLDSPSNEGRTILINARSAFERMQHSSSDYINSGSNGYYSNRLYNEYSSNYLLDSQN
ncbi:hypothetical protein AYI70_g1043 [Smittium culicis]|uniref:Uncharacterized protein n=1 Tax=Smittium culicis TaxID=133412 RepID=A0A1R1Y6S7_9FUNG|nr:hypothetical protein AYI70_g2708 [Smittium culicis]OMJ25214.1 hypothetical protein AYI70_g1043 [Smittium culicis]